MQRKHRGNGGETETAAGVKSVESFVILTLIFKLFDVRGITKKPLKNRGNGYKQGWFGFSPPTPSSGCDSCYLLWDWPWKRPQFPLQPTALWHNRKECWLRWSHFCVLYNFFMIIRCQPSQQTIRNAGLTPTKQDLASKHVIMNEIKQRQSKPRFDPWIALHSKFISHYSFSTVIRFTA